MKFGNYIKLKNSSNPVEEEENAFNSFLEKNNIDKGKIFIPPTTKTILISNTLEEIALHALFKLIHIGLLAHCHVSGKVNNFDKSCKSSQ